MKTRICKECSKEKPINEFQEGRLKCKDCVHKRQKEWYSKNKDRILKQRKKYRIENASKIKKWKLENKDKINETRRKYTKERFEKDYVFKLKHQLRTQLKRSFERKGKIKNKHTEEILGCTIDFFIKYLLNTYKNNYGVEWNKKEKVHIDHIIPLAIATTKEEVMQLCNYKNLQLLKAKDNLQKGIKTNYKIRKDNDDV